MTSDYPVVPSYVTVGQLVYEHDFSAGHNYLLIADGDKLGGILTLDDIQSVPQQKWDVTQAKEIMVPFDEQKMVSFDQDVLSIMKQMDENNINHIPVSNNGKVIGLMVRDNLLRFLHTHPEMRE
ncbi:MAG: CBS domain-containing protein [Dehalococcoidales bacterium]|nr:CBS domain-containing protein [Dehalococcoidales bacterium]